jgi:hypothetical protein
VKRSFALMILTGLLLVFSSGCTNKDYVRQQIEPLVDRISKLEAAQSAPDCCKKAEAAAERAEKAAKKAEKAFELQQRK